VQTAITAFSEKMKYDWILLNAAVLYAKEGVIQNINEDVLKTLSQKK